MSRYDNRRRSRGRGPRGGGFTLLEAIVTLVILTVTLPALVGGFNLASRIAISTKQKALATALARSRMDYLVSTGGWQTGDGMSFEEVDGNTTYHCDGVMSDWQDATVQNLMNVKQLDVTVSWIFEGVQEELTLSTVVYIPDYTPQAPGTTTGGL